MKLEKTGDYGVATENISKAALATAERIPARLILLDVMMPGLDGGNRGGRVQASPNQKGVPIVFLTAAITKGRNPRAQRPGRRAALSGQAGGSA